MQQQITSNLHQARISLSQRCDCFYGLLLPVAETRASPTGNVIGSDLQVIDGDNLTCLPINYLLIDGDHIVGLVLPENSDLSFSVVHHRDCVFQDSACSSDSYLKATAVLHCAVAAAVLQLLDGNA